uniref:CCHC-type domain-containing protein n=1 Tax=Amphimedon queenslandica TaxID=400682 RepID=A0A1X7U3U3_AMPQE
MATKKEGVTNRELATRLLNLVKKWTKRCKMLAEIKDLMVMEQLMKTLLGEIGIFVVARQPKTAGEAARLADDYHLLRRGCVEKKINGAIRCLRCRKMGHITRDCRAPLPQQTENKPKINNGKNKHKKGSEECGMFPLSTEGTFFF